ncbi:hypothetical protein JCM3770_003239 [Rhodotorula araucariae]
MSNQQPRITLRPPPHRDYLQGYPGIPASDPSTEPPPTPDPLLPLPHVLRPQAHLSGTVEVRSPAKGPIRARWLSVELEKIETVPAPPGDPVTGKGKSADPTKREGRYVELIGVGPNKLWEAGDSEGTDVPKSLVIDSPRKKGLKGVFSKSKAPAHDEDDEDGFGFIPDGNYPFEIPLPEGLPPTVEVDSKYNGIAYQIVASLCTKGKKGLLKGSTKPAIVIASASVLLNKADILPTWPAYQPVLPLPLPPRLPWAAPPGELTVGDTREAKLAIRRQDGTAGEVWMKTTREGLAFGPGDAVRVFVQIGWGGAKPIKLTRLDFVLRETLTYRHPSALNQSLIVRGTPKVTALFTANASVSPDPKYPTAFAVLYENEPVAFDLTGIVPNGHNRVTVRTAKHVDIAYHLKVRAMLEGGDELAVDNWPVVIGDCDARTAKGILLDIGYVEGLCDRGGLAPPVSAEAQSTASLRPAPQRQVSMPVSPAPTTSPVRHPTAEQLPPAPSPVASYQEAALEKSRLLNKPYNPAGSSFHVANPSAQDESRYRSSTPPPPLPAPAPVRPSFVHSPSAEEEKRSYYEQATRQRDALQSSLRSPQSLVVPSPVSAKPRASDSIRSPSVEEHVSVQRAAIVRRDSRDELGHPAPVRTASDRTEHVATQQVEGGPTFAMAHLAPTRSNTTIALSGSDVSASPSAFPSPPAAEPTPSHEQPKSPAVLLGRSLTSAEAEKRRLFLDAKETARKRQEEARLELERQNQALAELEFEEAQLAYEARLLAEAADERREVERLAREAFEAERIARIRQDEERWQHEEEERHAQARREMEERRRRAQQAMEEELRRFEAQHAEAERARAAEIERQMEERKREDEAKRAMADEMRRLDEERAREEQERKLAASRKAEMERQRADAERRRVEGEQARIAKAARRQAAEEAETKRRYEEAERARVRAEEDERARVRAEEEERYRREEEQRRHEAEEAERRRYEDEERSRLAEEDRQREAEAEARHVHQASQASTLAGHPNDGYSHPAYPAANGRSASYIQHVGAGLERAPSVASFAPSMSAAHATAEFYAQAIGQQSGLSEEKARYLAQLREQRGQVASPSPYGSSAPRPAFQDAAALQPAYPQGSAYPQPPQPPAHPVYASPPARQNSYASVGTSGAPSLPSKPALPAHTAVPTVPEAAPAATSTSTYKTAAEEKEEAAARRRAEDEAAARRDEESRGKQPVAIPEDEEAPPSYPVPVQGSSPQSAADEKAELERYYSAKAAVESQQRQAPPAPPSRLGPAPMDRSPLTSPVPTYQPAANGSPPSRPAYPAQLGHGALRASLHTIATTSDGSSHDLHRDPSVAAGKRAQHTPSSSAASDSLGFFAPSPAAPSAPAYPAHAEPVYAYQQTHHPQAHPEEPYPGQPAVGNGGEFGALEYLEYYDEPRTNGGGRTP